MSCRPTWICTSGVTTAPADPATQGAQGSEALVMYKHTRRLGYRYVVPFCVFMFLLAPATTCQVYRQFGEHPFSVSGQSPAAHFVLMQQMWLAVNMTTR